MGRPSSKTLAPFGERLRAAIERSEFGSRAAFVRYHDLEGATLYRYETGERSPPLKLVKAFAESLGVTVGELAGNDGGATVVERDDELSPYPEVEAFISDEISAGRAISDEHLAELRALRLYRSTVLSPYDMANATLASLRAADRGKKFPRRLVR